MSTAISFAGAQIDRADHIRSNPDALAALMDWRARLLRLDGLDPVIDAEGGLEWGTLADAPDGAELVFLGLAAEESGSAKGCFAAVPRMGDQRQAFANPRLWQAMAALSPGDLATYGGARSLVDWHARHRFCARCGQPTVLSKGGWQRNCISETCKGEHFPRVDPVTIMLVEHANDSGARLLLGRQPRFPPRRFSALAGFVEPGETIEEAVAREVHEEAGIRVNTVTYVASQPWPFPSQLMIGCHSIAADDEITIDKTELDEARWFSRDEVAYAMQAVATGAEDGAFIAPPRHAVAHHLLRWWLDR